MNSPDAAEIVKLDRVSKIFRKGESVITSLDAVSLSIRKNDYLSIMGTSGSGKSTLLSLVGCMTKPTSGRIWLEGLDISNATDSELSVIRASRIGFIFQNFYLLPNLTALKNIELPFLYTSISAEEATYRAVKALRRVNLEHRALHKPSELSGGEMQRIAIARAIVTDPTIILADEPTGSLDSTTGTSIMNLFSEIHALGSTILIVTHDSNVSSHAHKTLTIYDGVFTGDP